MDGNRRQMSPTSDLQRMLNEEKCRHRQQQELNVQLQEDYDELLKRVAEAELTIDRLRLGVTTKVHRTVVYELQPDRKKEQGATQRRSSNSSFSSVIPSFHLASPVVHRAEDERNTDRGSTQHESSDDWQRSVPSLSHIHQPLEERSVSQCSNAIFGPGKPGSLDSQHLALIFRCQALQEDIEKMMKALEERTVDIPGLSSELSALRQRNAGLQADVTALRHNHGSQLSPLSGSTSSNQLDEEMKALHELMKALEKMLENRDQCRPIQPVNGFSSPEPLSPRQPVSVGTSPVSWTSDEQRAQQPSIEEQDGGGLLEYTGNISSTGSSERSSRAASCAGLQHDSSSPPSSPTHSDHFRSSPESSLSSSSASSPRPQNSSQRSAKSHAWLSSDSDSSTRRTSGPRPRSFLGVPANGIGARSHLTVPLDIPPSSAVHLPINHHPFQIPTGRVQNGHVHASNDIPVDRPPYHFPSPSHYPGSSPASAQPPPADATDGASLRLRNTRSAATSTPAVAREQVSRATSHSSSGTQTTSMPSPLERDSGYNGSEPWLGQRQLRQRVVHASSPTNLAAAGDSSSSSTPGKRPSSPSRPASVHESSSLTTPRQRLSLASSSSSSVQSRGSGRRHHLAPVVTSTSPVPAGLRVQQLPVSRNGELPVSPNTATSEAIGTLRAQLASLRQQLLEDASSGSSSSSSMSSSPSFSTRRSVGSSTHRQSSTASPSFPRSGSPAHRPHDHLSSSSDHRSTARRTATPESISPRSRFSSHLGNSPQFSASSLEPNSDRAQPSAAAQRLPLSLSTTDRGVQSSPVQLGSQVYGAPFGHHDAPVTVGQPQPSSSGDHVVRDSSSQGVVSVSDGPSPPRPHHRVTIEEPSGHGGGSVPRTRSSRAGDRRSTRPQAASTPYAVHSRLPSFAANSFSTPERSHDGSFAFLRRRFHAPSDYRLAPPVRGEGPASEPLRRTHRVRQTPSYSYLPVSRPRARDSHSGREGGEWTGSFGEPSFSDSRSLHLSSGQDFDIEELDLTDANRQASALKRRAQRMLRDLEDEMQ